MIAATVSTIVLALLGSVPGETAAWRTGEVTFIAYVQGDEYREIFPLGTGQYTVNVSIEQVTSDPDSVLGYVGGVPVCYELPMGIRQNDYIEVTGTYYGGVNPVPYCGRVVASSVTKLGEWEKPAEEEAPENLRTPRVVTGAPEVTETTVTLQATILDNGGELCRARFVYRAEAGATWYTGWQPDLDSGESIAQKIAGLTPGTRYYFYVEVENSTEWTTGNQVAVVTLPEKVPPIAHPAVWLVAPDQGGLGSLTMTADIERDLAGPQEYYFDFVGSPTGGAGGSDSYWQFSPLYEDVGLNANQQYGYRIKARDGHGNETAYAPTVHAYTDIETPAGVTFGEITAGSIQIKASGTLSGLNRGQSGLRLENITTGDASAWQQDNTFWTCTGLLVNTPYTFRARAQR